MKKNAIVRKINTDDPKRKNIVIVEPIAYTECAGCHENCSKKGNLIPAANTQNLSLKEGSLVIISSSKTQEALESIIFLLFPIVSAITGFVLSNPIYSFFMNLKKSGTLSTACPESIKAVIVLLFFASASLLVFILSRTKKLMLYPEITDVLEQGR
ncbi:MAG: SoxR reducing system RseC family protein [Treponema sp.]|nr:SoxR reducing system RseC family protein [Treponema sp.]